MRDPGLFARPGSRTTCWSAAATPPPTGEEDAAMIADRGAKVNGEDAGGEAQRRWVFARIWITPRLVVVKFGSPSQAAYRRARADLAAIVAPQRLDYDRARAEYVLP